MLEGACTITQTRHRGVELSYFTRVFLSLNLKQLTVIILFFHINHKTLLKKEETQSRFELSRQRTKQIAKTEINYSDQIADEFVEGFKYRVLVLFEHEDILGTLFPRQMH